MAENLNDFARDAYANGIHPLEFAEQLVRTVLEVHQSVVLHWAFEPDPPDELGNAALARRILGNLLDAGWTAARFAFTDPIRSAECVLVVPDGGRVFPVAPDDPQIGVEHGGCGRVADLAIELDAFYCPACQWNGRISGGWAVDMIRAVTQ